MESSRIQHYGIILVGVVLAVVWIAGIVYSLVIGERVLSLLLVLILLFSTGAITDSISLNV